MRRTVDWAPSLARFWRFCRCGNPEQQALFGIVQGGTHAALRLECADALVEMNFPGYAVGGLAVGEPHEVTCAMTEIALHQTPARTPSLSNGSREAGNRFSTMFTWALT